MAVLARQPDLLAPFLGWAAALALNGVLSKRDHELLGARVASNCKSEFEWVEHVEYARAAGLPKTEIATVAEPDRRGRLDRRRARPPPRRRRAAQAPTTSPTRRGRSSPSTTTPPALVEILFVVGQYTMLSMVANAGGGVSGCSQVL